jgi:exoribonuclease R
MKALAVPDDALAIGLTAIRTRYKVPGDFPADALAEAQRVAGRSPTDHVDRTDRPFVTLDPASSTDLDQAFAIERSGADIILHYAIADVGWFVDDGGALDRAAWERGATLYLPDGKASLYPPILSEGAASLLPDGDRPAVVFTVRVAPDGGTRLDGVERAIVRSRAKLAYETVRPDELPDGFTEIAERSEAAEAARGATRVDPPEQEVVADDGHYRLLFRPILPSERQNAALSLATNMAVADLQLRHRTGLFRIMPEADSWAVRRLRHTAKALELAWPKPMSLQDFERTLDPADPAQAAFMMAVRRAGPKASYSPYAAGAKPWHSAMAATYAHATAPLRRLADRYVVRAALALANGQPVPDAVARAFPLLPEVMDRADAADGQLHRATIDLAEAVMLRGEEGRSFAAVVTDIDERGARIQLCALPIIARVKANGVGPGDRIEVRLTSADPALATIRFERAA